MPIDQDIVGLLTQQLIENIPVWVGKDAKRLAPVSGLLTRMQSFSIQYELKLEDGQLIPLRIKIPCHQDTESLAEAMGDEQLQLWAKREFELLQAMYTLVRQQKAVHITAVKALGYLPDMAAIVMVEMPARNLEEWLFDLRMRLGSRAHRQRIKDTMISAGQLLQLYHKHIGEAEIQLFNSQELIGQVEKHFHKFSHSRKLLQRYDLPEQLTKVIQSIDQQPVPYASQHRDFTFKNIVTTQDNCVAILDMDAQFFEHKRPIYMDISHLIGDMMTQKVKLLSLGFMMPAAFLERCEGLFLQGYFSDQQYDTRFLGLYKALSMLYALKWYDRRINAIGEKRRKLALWAYPVVQSYLIRKARTYLDEAMQ